MTELPIVRLEIDHMRHAIVMAFNRYADDLKDHVQIAVDRAVAGFDFDREVGAIADRLIRDAVDHSLRRAIQDLKFDDAVSKALSQHILRYLQEPEAR